MNIAAIATPHGVGAISIIRTSGENCIELVSKIFTKDLTKVKSHTIHYGYIKYKGEIVDEVMVSVMKAPKTFTAEDSVEINCHGGLFVTSRVLETLLKVGFRLAEPGEFSKRAFLNGRIDLTQSEAIMDIIAATNEQALKISNQGLRKDVSALVAKLREQVLTILAKIELHIDYPEYDDEVELTNQLVIPYLEEVIKFMNEILERSKIGKTIVSGIKTAILGKPNVGKSSLLNYLLDEDKAIVSDIEGTTRDIVEGVVNIGNLTLNLVDTAGIRKSSDELENIGITKSLKTLESCDLVILVLDSSNIQKEDYELLEITSKIPRVVVVNKSDLNKKLKLDCDYLLISAKEKCGIELLQKRIVEVTKINSVVSNGSFLTNVRQISLLDNAIESLNNALIEANNNQLIDLIAIDIKQAYDSLGEIIGETSKDSLLNELFSKFCLGK